MSVQRIAALVAEYLRLSDQVHEHYRRHPGQDPELLQLREDDIIGELRRLDGMYHLQTALTRRHAAHQHGLSSRSVH